MVRRKKVSKWQILAIRNGIHSFLEKEAESEQQSDVIARFISSLSEGTPKNLIISVINDPVFENEFFNSFWSYLSSTTDTSNLTEDKLFDGLYNFISNKSNIDQVISNVIQKGQYDAQRRSMLQNILNQSPRDYYLQLERFESDLWSNFYNIRNIKEFFTGRFRAWADRVNRIRQQQLSANQPNQQQNISSNMYLIEDIMRENVRRAMEEARRRQMVNQQQNTEQQTQSKYVVPESFEDAVRELGEYIPWIGGLLLPAISSVAETTNSVGSELLNQLKEVDFDRYLTPELKFSKQRKS